MFCGVRAGKIRHSGYFPWNHSERKYKSLCCHYRFSPTPLVSSLPMPIFLELWNSLTNYEHIGPREISSAPLISYKKLKGLSMRKYKIEGKQREKLPGDGVPFCSGDKPKVRLRNHKVLFFILQIENCDEHTFVKRIFYYLCK